MVLCKVFRLEMFVILFFTFCAYECSACPRSCLCYGSTVECNLGNTNGNIQPNLPHGTAHLILKNWGSQNLTWDSVTHLELLDTMYNCNEPILQLRNLTSLKIYTKLFFNHFEILDIQSHLAVKNLHFSGIKNLSFTDVTNLLNGSRFSTLEELVLDRISTDNDDPVLNISSDFFTALSNKTELRRLYLTNLNLNSIDILNSICPPRFNYLSLKGTAIGSVISHYDIHNTHVCETLKTVDISEVTVRQVHAQLKVLNLFSNMKFTGQIFRLSLYKYFRNVENLLVNDFNKIQLVVRGITVDVSYYKFRLRRIEGSGNNLKFINATFISSPEIGIVECNVSNNIIEYFSPNFLYHPNFLRKLDLHSNRLYKMQRDFPVDLVDAVQRLSSLRYLNVSNNRLTAIPRATFSKSRELRHLDLGHNELTMISFSLASCSNLEYLSLVGNRIYFRDINSVEPLNEVIIMFRRNMDEQKKSITADAVLTVDLSGNSFSCSCDNTDMQTWILDNTDVLICNVNKGYMCSYNGKEYSITTDEVKEIWKDCYLQHMLRISLPLAVFSILIVFLIIFFTRRRMIRNRLVRRLMRRLQRDEFPLQFLLFISYCSADDKLVLDYILPTLSQSIKEVTKTDRDFICLGDQHFRLGHMIVEEIMRSIEQSAVVVLVISNKYTKSPWCDMEAKEAETQRKPIVLILTEKIEEKEMSAVLKRIFNRYTRFKCFRNEEGQHDVSPTWDALSKSIVELASAQMNI